MIAEAKGTNVIFLGGFDMSAKERSPEQHCEERQHWWTEQMEQHSPEQATAIQAEEEEGMGKV
jgi:hypothetical protein